MLNNHLMTLGSFTDSPVGQYVLLSPLAHPPPKGAITATTLAAQHDKSLTSLL